MNNLITRFVREEAGQDLIEYVFLAMFIALAVITGLIALGTTLNTEIGNVSTQLSGTP